MDHALIAIAIFVATAGCSLGFVRAMIPLATKIGLVDHPGPRRVNAYPLPRAAGPAFLAAFVVGITLTFMLNVERFAPEVERLALVLAGATFITLVMFYDDVLGIAPLPKLGLQCMAAAIVIAPRLRGDAHGIVIERFNTPFGGTIELPLLLAIGFTLFWTVGMMNTMNWVDGLDGLAGTVTLVACGVMFAHTYFWPRDNPQFTISLLAVTLAGVVTGFLVFNWHPARIIMGDAGANFLGFSLAMLSIIGGAKIATALLALGLPILDVAWVILYRLLNGRSPLAADRGHLHHRLLDLGWSQPQVVAFVGGISAIFGIASLLLPTRETKLGAILVLGIMLLGIIAVLARKERLVRPTKTESRLGGGGS